MSTCATETNAPPSLPIPELTVGQDYKLTFSVRTSGDGWFYLRNGDERCHVHGFDQWEQIGWTFTAAESKVWIEIPAGEHMDVDELKVFHESNGKRQP